MRKRLLMNLTSWLLAVYFMAPWGLGQCEAAGKEEVHAIRSSVSALKMEDFPTGTGEEEDVFADFFASIAQLIDKALSFDSTGHTSVISIWNH